MSQKNQVNDVPDYNNIYFIHNDYHIYVKKKKKKKNQ